MSSRTHKEEELLKYHFSGHWIFEISPLKRRKKLVTWMIHFSEVFFKKLFGEKISDIIFFIGLHIKYNSAKNNLIIDGLPGLLI